MSEISYEIHHASLVVADTAKSLNFYSGVLGMRQTERPELPFPGAWLLVGAQQIHLLELENPDPTTGRPQHGGRDRHVALSVPDLEAVRARLEKHNVAYTLSISGRKALFCRDLDGNAIEILQLP